jgi:endo-1,4-beta-xylanase
MIFRGSQVLVCAVALGLLQGTAYAQETVRAQPALKAAFQQDFLVGTTLNLDEVYGRDLRDLALMRHHFNAISPENLLKWESVQPVEGEFAFEAADRFVALGEKEGMFIVGHALVWHNQTPRWVFEDADGGPATRETLVRRMREHIHTIVGRYRGRIHGWDVVNEALNEDGTLRQSPWLTGIGEDYIALAFQFAHEADPDAELYYNDYSMAGPEKRAGAVRLISRLQAQGVPITGVGMQGHHKMDWPTIEEEGASITAFADLGLEVMITELDIDLLPRVNRGNTAEVALRGTGTDCRCELDPYVGGLPDSVQQAPAQRYADFFELYRKHRDVISRVTFWGMTDEDSWLNDWPVRGRTNHPLLFDRRGEPKPALDAVIRVARPESAAAIMGSRR